MQLTLTPWLARVAVTMSVDPQDAPGGAKIPDRANVSRREVVVICTLLTIQKMSVETASQVKVTLVPTAAVTGSGALRIVPVPAKMGKILGYPKIN